MRLVSSPLSSDVDVVRVAYDTVAEDYAAYLPDARAEAPLDLAMVDAFVQAVGTGEPVLDAGCGAGRMSRHLADRGVEVSGVDLSPGMISMARRDHPDLEFQAGEGTRDASARTEGSVTRSGSSGSSTRPTRWLQRLPAAACETWRVWSEDLVVGSATTRPSCCRRGAERLLAPRICDLLWRYEHRSSHR